MGKKEKRIREYFFLRYEFAKLHHSEVNFRKEPTDKDIMLYSKNFTIEDLENKIRAVELQLEATTKRLKN